MTSKGRRWLLDFVALLAAIGMIYGALEIVAVKGWWAGLPLAILAAVAGYLSFEVLYPLWFGRR